MEHGRGAPAVRASDHTRAAAAGAAQLPAIMPTILMSWHFGFDFFYVEC